jgi:hypothetical protein
VKCTISYGMIAGSDPSDGSCVTSGLLSPVSCKKIKLIPFWKWISGIMKGSGLGNLKAHGLRIGGTL